jgi:hypothetical protein
MRNGPGIRARGRRTRFSSDIRRRGCGEEQRGPRAPRCATVVMKLLTFWLNVEKNAGRILRIYDGRIGIGNENNISAYRIQNLAEGHAFLNRGADCGRLAPIKHTRSDAQERGCNDQRRHQTYRAADAAQARTLLGGWRFRCRVPQKCSQSVRRPVAAQVVPSQIECWPKDEEQRAGNQLGDAICKQRTEADTADSQTHRHGNSVVVTLLVSVDWMRRSLCASTRTGCRTRRRRNSLIASTTSNQPSATQTQSEALSVNEKNQLSALNRMVSRV